MPRKVTLEDKIAKRDRLLGQIKKKRADIQPKVDAYNAIDAEIQADLAQLDKAKRDAVYDHVMSVFGEDITVDEFKTEFDKLINDTRNKNFVEHLKRLQEQRQAVVNSSEE
ncbi:MAG: hypothetical protein IKP47_08640 [Ruminococcus sp.]|nr:hypothetical protein [Ruminococcus sp.]